MGTIDKGQFLRRHGMQALDVDRLGSKLGEAKGADQDGNGVIQGDTELGKLFDLFETASGLLETQGSKGARYEALTALLRPREQVDPFLSGRALAGTPEFSAIAEGAPGAALRHYASYGALRRLAGAGLLQDALNELGFTVSLGANDANRGIFGDGTRAAVVRFQRERGVSEPYGEGVVGPATVAALDQALLLKRGVGVPNLPLMEQPVLASIASGQRVLSRDGAFHPELALVQDRLRALGYALDLGVNDKNRGIFGPLTEGLLKMFQRVHRLPASGELNQVTLEALDAVAALPSPTRVRTVDEANAFFLTQFGPTAYNSADGAPFGKNDCGPTSISMTLSLLGLLPHPAAAETSEVIDLVRDTILGRDSLWSITMDVPSIKKGLRAFGAACESRKAPPERATLDAALEQGSVFVLGGQPYVAWAKTAIEADGYLVKGDPKDHYVVLMGKTADGRYLVGDPLMKNGVMAVSAATLDTFLSSTWGVLEASRRT